MCHLNNLRVPHQLPGDLQYNIWTDINKVIDDLHIKNHKNSSCREQYNTDSLKKENNAMACEQTFAWLHAKVALSLLPAQDGKKKKQIHFILL